jgi:very-short-patch-repair endonuclease
LKSMSLKDWKFTGAGPKSIAGKFPDFSNGDHKIIEVFGDYWHTKEEEIERIKYFNDKGYDCLILWESQIDKDIDAVKNTVSEFVCNKLSKVVSVERIPYTGLVYNLEVAEDNSYVTEFATVHNCERPVNQESNFDIIKGYSAGKDAILGKTIDTKGPNPTMWQEPSLGGVLKGEGEGSTQLVGMSDAELKTLGEKAGGNFEAVDFKEFKMGLKVEQEHYDLTGMDPFKTAKIVLAHMRELKDYYTQLDAMEKRGEKVVKAVSHKDELMQFFTEHPAPDDKEVHALADKLKIEPDALEEEIYSLLADELGKCSVMKNLKGLSLGEKCKAVFRVSEDDMTRDEQSQNEATLRKEMSHCIDHGSNETNRQSPDVQTPVTKIGEIHMGKTGLKEFKKFMDKSSTNKGVNISWDSLHPQSRQEVLHGAGFQTNLANKKWGEFQDWERQTLLDSINRRSKGKTSLNTEKATDGLKDYVDRNVNIKKKQPPAMAPPAPGLSWNPVTHRWVKKGQSELLKEHVKKSISEEDTAGLVAFLDFMKDEGKS